jgi:hypothetical protein
MAQQIYITYIRKLKDIATTIDKSVLANNMLEISENGLSPDNLFKLASMSTTEFFYVINSDTEIFFPNFDFSFKPPEWDKELLHIWNNDFRVRLYNRDSVLQDPIKYSDEQLLLGNVSLKSLSGRIYEYPISDIVFISYDEEYANRNYAKIKERFPRALRTHGVKGIFEAHKAAARIATTDMVYIVDADALVSPTFNFDYYPTGYDIKAVHVWHSQNPVNDLIYGYGGVKLFPRHLLLDYTGSPIDFTTSVSKHFKVMKEISNITCFNTDPFSAWRSGFRECAKLASKIITNHDNTETEERLSIWCTVGADREFGDFAIMGANEGMAYGTAHKDQPDMLGLINDYSWLEQKFSN